MAKQEYICIDCNVGVILPLWEYKRKRQPFRCPKCSRSNAVEIRKNMKYTDPERWEYVQMCKSEAAKRKHSKTTFEERSAHGKKMRSSVKITGSEMRANQQKFIDNAGDEYYKKYCEKRKKISLDFHHNMTDVEKEEHYRKIFKNNGRSKACEACLNIIEESDIQIEREKCIHGFFVDGLIIGTNIIIEFYGDMFHCNPRKFHDPDQYCSWISRTVQQQWDRDRKRISALLMYGYNVVIIWEQDWTTDKQPQLTRILNEKNNYDNVGNVDN